MRTHSASHMALTRTAHAVSAVGKQDLPVLLTIGEAAELLRTSRRAIYAMVERHQLPGIVRIRRRVLLRADDLLHWLDQNRAPALESPR